MTETKKMQLHLGRCIEDLDKLHTVPDLKAKRATVLVRTGQTLAAEAAAAAAAGDEERAYVYYMKYLRVVGALARHPDYRQHARYYCGLLGPNAPKAALQNADNLKTSLIQRYKSEMSAQCAEQPAQEELLPALDKAQQEAQHEDAEENDQVISSERLHRLLFGPDHGSKVLVLDARSEEQYSRARVAHAAVVSVPAVIITRGLSAGALRRALPESSRTAWEARADARLVVLMDESSASDGTPPWPPHTLHTLATILLKWDVGTVERRVTILRGGFADWALHYPWLTAGAGHAAAPPPAPPSLADMLDDIDYPSWEDILTADEETVEEQMKDPPKAVELPAVESPTVEPFVDRSNKVNDPIVDRSSKTSEPIVDRSSKAGEPIVDRSSKAAAAALYARALARQQQLAEAALAAERARLAAEQDWPAVRAAADTLREQEILSQLLQLESKQHDMEQENRELRARLEQYLRQDAARVDDELARRQTAIQEAAEQRAQLHERAQELELARVRRQQEEPTEPVPTVDRATKPPPDAPWWQRSLEGEPGDVPPGHTGLRNLGNSCYLNACVQCLSHTPGLASAFADKDFYKQIDRGARSSGSLVVELALVVRALWSGQWRWLAPWELRTAVGQALPMFRGGGQHDCHELLTLMLDRLDQQLTAPIGHKSNVLHSLYTGSTASTVRCARCQHASVSEESFTSLSLELGEATSRCSLTDCLRRHAQHESLAGWRCDKCHVAAGATKRLALALPPRALVLHLKRFHIQPAEGGPRTVKRQTLVTFPLRGLDARLLGASSRVLYHLYAVANHYGSSGSGHYTAVVRAGQQWLMLDDHAVRAVPPEDVVSSAAYLLFYERGDRE